MAKKRDQRLVMTCSHRLGKTKGKTTFSNPPNNVGLKLHNVTIKAEKNRANAVARFNRQRSYSHPTILKPFALSCFKRGTTKPFAAVGMQQDQDRIISLTERVPPILYKNWVKGTIPLRWSRSSIEPNKIVGIRSEHREVFKQLGGALKEIMLRGEFHGDIQKGFRMRDWNEGKLILCNNKFSNLSFEDGLKKDIRDYRNIVQMFEMVDSYDTSINESQPALLELFYLLCDDAQSLTGKDLTYERDILLLHIPNMWKMI